MSDWDDLVRAGLLGTRRAAAPPVDGPLGGLLAGATGPTPEAVLLRRAAAFSAYERAGRLPDAQAVASAVAVADDRPLCPPIVARYLLATLDNRFPAVLPEVLAIMAKAGWRAPAIFTPNLLERGKRVDLRGPVLELVGSEGRRLAAANPSWWYAAVDPTDWPGLLRAWRDAGAARRGHLLSLVRLADPVTGRQLLESTWQANDTSARRQLIRLLETGISLDDEPFLEAALDDRDHVVRQRAAEMLAFLPTSRYAARLAGYADRIVRWSGEPGASLAVVFPAEINAVMRRDGLPVHAGRITSQFRMRQLGVIVGATPLDHWTTRWGASPATIARVALESRWPRTLITALSRAAWQQGNEAWAEALLTVDEATLRTGRLVRLLAPEACAGLVEHFRRRLNGAAALERNGPLYMILRFWPHPWPAAPARQWIGDFAARVAADQGAQQPDALLRSTIGRLALQAPPELAAFAEECLRPALGEASPWAITVERFLATLHFRRSLHEDLAALAGVRPLKGESNE